ncbi:group II intron reverse transcriptase/maturase [Sporosarcina sp. resist]|uniref:group II intron reverse transcriptase/maturase n=1 Tax=Sporosarcina sp. resist TaxID=2762563 RepID=UPI00164D5680|nr:group II intron reverse transcriptase/maturase [Sporosarcina sp. resist]QNK86256.1 group II intron reverse transcriptase/maturase [Sporosarcina sp. resist]QNK89909.1 group II intron reverse transcriptase/maturase [Sporosarcina sp. resist]
MQTNLRYWEYYNMTDTFTDLYERSKQDEKFTRLYELIISRENILLAFRAIKSNKGSKTQGTDGRTINNIKTMKDEEIVAEVQRILLNYQPKKVRRVFIPKPNGDERPLGIPCIMDRLIQQCFKQVLEPIAEAKFYNHSYGFRPLRSTHHAMARTQFLINRNKLHFVVDIDIKGFFDNINHTLLIKQLWNIGIQDRQVLKIISKMLKAEIDGEGIPTKGTPQGGILSPLLSNIVLNDLDQWVAGQWELFETQHKYTQWNKYTALKNTKLKEGFIVRYADDFKIMCKDWKTAEKWFHAVRLYLKDRLKLDISPEKSQIVNLRKSKSEFLGFTIRAEMKRNIFVAQTGVMDKKKQDIKKEYRARIKTLRNSPTAQNARKFNSFILGLHNYFIKATMVNIEFSRMAFDLSNFTINRLKSVGKYEKPKNPTKVYKKFYRNNFRTHKVAEVYLFPLADIKTSNNMNFSQDLTPFTVGGRDKIHQKLKPDIFTEINKLMNSYIPNRTTEYMDNRISRYSMKNGKCEITELFLFAEDVHCHHYKPISLEGTDEFKNLRILHKDVHRLIHATKDETINRLIKFLKLTDEQIKKTNQYRKFCNLELID